MYQLKIQNESGVHKLTILKDGNIIRPLERLYATKDDALQVGKLLEAANDNAAVDANLVHELARDVEASWGMSGLAGTMYEDYALEILARYLAARHK